MSDSLLNIDDLRQLGVISSKEEELEIISRDIVDTREEIVNQSNNVRVSTQPRHVQSEYIVNLNNIIIGVYEDYFQKLYIDSSLLKYEYPVEIYSIQSDKDISNLKNLTRKSIFNESTIIKLTLKCKVNNNVLNFLKSIYYKNKIVIIYTQNQRTANFLSTNLKMYFENNDKKIPIIKLKNTDDYKVKKDLIEQTVTNMGIKTKNKEVKQLLVKIIIARIKEFETIKTSLDVAIINDLLVTEEYLEDIAGNIDFYKLDDLFENILRGITYKKVMKQLNYFLEIKKYNPNWLLNQFREYILKINNAYSLTYNGILKHPIDKDTLKSRILASGFSGLHDFYNVNKYEQQIYLDIISDIPYKYIAEMSKIILNKSNLNVDKTQLYSVILELYSLKNKYGEDKGFKNNRKLNEMKANAKYRKKLT